MIGKLSSIMILRGIPYAKESRLKLKLLLLIAVVLQDVAVTHNVPVYQDVGA